MSRSTFSGPILSGDNRTTPFRNVGYTTLTQQGYLNLANTTAGTAGYAGGSGIFVTNNPISNTFTPVYVPNSSSTTLTAQTIPADTASQIYRGFVFYLPVGSDIDQVLIDVAVVPTTSGTAPTTIKMYMSNNYTVELGTATYSTVASISAVGRQTIALTGTQVTNSNTTSTDIVLGNGQPNLSQYVITLSIAGGTMGTLATGQIYVAIRYVQPDNNIGTSTAYPYGNLT